MSDYTKISTSPDKTRFVVVADDRTVVVGPRGPAGPKGDPQIHIGPTPPTDVTMLWVDTSA